MKLYTYFRSSAAFRVRIALALKGIDYESVSISLMPGVEAHRGDDYRAINPQMRIPSLELDDGTVLTQSMAIIEYLEECYAEPSILPGDPEQRAKARAIADIIACDLHPLNNSGTLKYLREKLNAGEEAVSEWYRFWLRGSMEAVEAMIAPGPYAMGDAVTIADICIVPQVFNAFRFNVHIEDLHRVCAAHNACMALDAFSKSQPSMQPDATG